MTSPRLTGDPRLAGARGGSLVPLQSVLCTDEVRGRQSRAADHEGDARAEEALAQALADSPGTVLQALADTVLTRLDAGSAGVSVLDGDGAAFRWPAVAGRWKPHAASGTPRDLGPCGDALDRDAALAFAHPERRYIYLKPLVPPMAELLVAPFRVEGRAVGTLWAALHGDRDRGHFDAEDLRRLVGLARFGAAAYRVKARSTRANGAAQSTFDGESLDMDESAADTPTARRRAALNLLEDAVQARQTVERVNEGLRESEAQLAIELAATRQLQSVSALLVENGTADALYQKLVDAAVTIMGANMGSLQTLDEAQNALRLLAWQGFDASFGERFELNRPDAGTACARAWQQGQRMIVADVETCDFMAGTPALEDLRAAGIRAVQSTPLFSRSGRLVGVISTHWHTPHEPTPGSLRSFDILARQAADLIERKVTEEAVGRLAAIVASSADAIIGTDLEGVITTWNFGAEQQFGYAQEELLGQPVIRLVAPGREEDVAEILRRVQRGDQIASYETIGRRKDGSTFDISITVSPVRDALGRIIGAAAIARDITDHKRSEQALREADHRKNEFLAILAHELRGPLAPIRNGLQIIASPGATPEAVASAEAMVQRQVDHMARLIDDLIDINRISRGKLELRKEAIDLNATVRSVAEAARPAFDGMGHRLTLRIPADAIYVSADPTRLSQIVGNLLNNARKFTDRGGRIDVTVAPGEKQVEIRVRDNGIGIAGRDLPGIFQMFSQVDNALERSRGGLGIGLSLVRSLVEMHGGTIAARSGGAGQGSEFIVYLPTLAGAPAQVPQATPVPRSLRARRILVVDDNRDSVESLALLLRMAGHDLRMAHDGLEAVEEAGAFRPEIVLLDLGLPRLNGYEAARRIRSQPGGRDVRLIAISGWGQEDDRRRSREAGFDAHLVKPVDLSALELLIATFEPGDAVPPRTSAS